MCLILWCKTSSYILWENQKKKQSVPTLNSTSCEIARSKCSQRQYRFFDTQDLSLQRLIVAIISRMCTFRTTRITPTGAPINRNVLHINQFACAQRYCIDNLLLVKDIKLYMKNAFACFKQPRVLGRFVNLADFALFKWATLALNYAHVLCSLLVNAARCNGCVVCRVVLF